MKKYSLLCLFFLFILGFSLFAMEITEGPLRLVLHPSGGRFSLYSTAINRERPEALFYDRDPRTSFLSLMVNDRVYKMGDTLTFRTHLTGDASRPAFVFESSFMIVSQEFIFVVNPLDSDAIGIRMIFTITNTSEEALSVGARYLLDTMLSEKSSSIEFATDHRIIDSETLITVDDDFSFWVDRAPLLALAGSLVTGGSGNPDSIHIANWQRLSNASWKPSFVGGRNFNLAPYSFRDTGIAYYFEPETLAPQEQRVFNITLALAGNGNTALPYTAIYPSTPSGEASLRGGDAERERDLRELREILTRINILLSSGTVNEEELNALESSLDSLRSRYNMR